VTIELDQATPEQHRARYAELKARGAERRTLSPGAYGDTTSIEPLQIVSRETIPGGWYASFRVARWQSLRLVDIAGVSTVSLMLWNADEPSERYNSGDTVKLQWTARLSSGRLLFSDMGRVLASITADTCGAHDAIVGGSTQASNQRRYGNAGLRNSRDNLVLAAGKLGLGVADVPTPIAFFADLRTDEDGRFVWHGGAAAPGRLVELRAEMNLLVAVSNCPHPFDPRPDYAPGPVEATVWRSPPPAADDPARHNGEEAERGFINTDREFRA
jgi:urea carboxylase-associated protein 2